MRPPETHAEDDPSRWNDKRPQNEFAAFLDGKVDEYDIDMAAVVRFCKKTDSHPPLISVVSIGDMFEIRERREDGPLIVRVSGEGKIINNIAFDYGAKYLNQVLEMQLELLQRLSFYQRRVKSTEVPADYNTYYQPYLGKTV